MGLNATPNVKMSFVRPVTGMEIALNVKKINIPEIHANMNVKIVQGVRVISMMENVLIKKMIVQIKVSMEKNVQLPVVI
jgi:hypothetical protein